MKEKNHKIIGIIEYIFLLSMIDSIHQLHKKHWRSIQISLNKKKVNSLVQKLVKFLKEKLRKIFIIKDNKITILKCQLRFGIKRR
jgi:hypothetical protein